MASVNPCRDIRMEKLIVHCGVGASGDKLTRATKVITDLTGQKTFTGVSRLSIRQFGIRRGEHISCAVTVRGEKAREILERALRVKEFELPASAFSDTGCFGFGINEHIDLNMPYDRNIGIFGLDFYVVLKRMGAHVSRRKHAQGVIGNKHRITAQEARDWFVQNLDGVILEH